MQNGSKRDNVECGKLNRNFMEFHPLRHGSYNHFSWNWGWFIIVLTTLVCFKKIYLFMLRFRCTLAILLYVITLYATKLNKSYLRWDCRCRYHQAFRVWPLAFPSTRVWNEWPCPATCDTWPLATSSIGVWRRHEEAKKETRDPTGFFNFMPKLGNPLAFCQKLNRL